MTERPDVEFHKVALFKYNAPCDRDPAHGQTSAGRSQCCLRRSLTTSLHLVFKLRRV